MTGRKKIIASLLIGGGTLVSSLPALANDSEELEKLRALVQNLDQKIRVLERKNEIADEEAAAKKKETPIVKAGENGFGFQSADGNFTLNLHGQIQADGRFFQNGGNGTSLNNLGTASGYEYNNLPNASGPAAQSYNSFLLKQFRPIISGTVYGIYDYNFVPDFGQGATLVQDAWVNAKLTDGFQVEVGKQKSPFGLERLQTDVSRKFAELALTNNLVPNRDIGVNFHGQLLDNRLEYNLGYFDGVPDGQGTNNYANSDTDNNRDKDFLVRVFAKPFKNAPGFLQGLGFGLGATYSNLTGNGSTTSTGSTDVALGASDTNLSSYKTDLGQQIFFSYYNLANNNASGASGLIGAPDKYATYANGERFRWSPQFTYTNGPFGLYGEYVGEYQAVSKYADEYSPLSAVGGTLPSGTHASLVQHNARLHNQAWQIAASWVLTGEDAGPNVNPKPKSKFDLNGGGWGAWELVGRYSRLDIDDAAFSALNTASGWSNAGGALSGNSYADPRVSAKSAQAWATGINWYPNNIIKLQLDYEHTSFEGGYTTDGIHVVNRPSEDVVLGRVQLAF